MIRSRTFGRAILSLLVGIGAAACGSDEPAADSSVSPGDTAPADTESRASDPPSTTTVPSTSAPTTSPATTSAPPTPSTTTAPTTTAPVPRPEESLGFAGNCEPFGLCITLALAEDGTIVSYDRSTATVSFARGTPAPVRLAPSAEEGILYLVAVGPDDVLYFVSEQPESADPVGYVKAVSTHPDNAGLTIAAGDGVDLSGDSDLVATPAGLVSVGCCGGERRPALDAPLVMPWVDHMGGPATSARADVWIEYPGDGSATFHVAAPGGATEWSVPNATTRSMPPLGVLADGGVLVDLTDPFVPDQPSRVVRLAADGSITEASIGTDLVYLIEPTGSLVVFRDNEFLRISPFG